MKTKTYIDSVDLTPFMRENSINRQKLFINKTTYQITRQSGFSLIEVMISAFVLSISLLGILGMQVYSMKTTQHSYMKQQAMGIVQNVMERMAVNRLGVEAGDYDNFDTQLFNCAATPPDCTTKTCSSTEIALLDKLNIGCGYKKGTGSRTGGIKVNNADDIVALTNGRLRISCRDIVGLVRCSGGDVAVTINWTERALGDEKVEEDTLSLNLKISAQ